MTTAKIDSGKIDKTFIRKGKITEQGNDFEYWQSRSVFERIMTLEQIRHEYNLWKYGAEQRLQRVYTIGLSTEPDRYHYVVRGA